MNNSMNNRRNVARAERQQRKEDAGHVAEHFPQVARIVISMTYTQRGIGKSLPRTVHFVPASYALFAVSCLDKDCVDGGFDFTQIITGMIGRRKEVTKGELSCEGNGLAVDHSNVEYEVVIQYV